MRMVGRILRFVGAYCQTRQLYKYCYSCELFSLNLTLNFCVGVGAEVALSGQSYQAPFLNLALCSLIFVPTKFSEQ